ncbi:MAG TPA: deoxyribose-phosphate aldolase [Bdellovibrionota bacterium]|nr:deoxyribose-phosphate aldolase [Bdellovibrionota bacterium]
MSISDLQNLIDLSREKIARELNVNASIFGSRTSFNRAPSTFGSASELARRIDHTLLKPDATSGDIEKLCDEALEFRFAGVCVNPIYVERISKRLSGTDVKAITVVGFPLGATTTAAKVFETEEAVGRGAQEIDMVMNIGAFKSKHYLPAYDDISAVVEAARGNRVKVILETALLTTEDKVEAAFILQAAGAAFAKTSTGFGPGVAAVEDVQLLRRVLSDRVQIKASGGIRTREQALALLQAGASRIGTRSGVTMVR